MATESIPHVRVAWNSRAERLADWLTDASKKLKRHDVLACRYESMWRVLGILILAEEIEEERDLS